MLEFDDLPCTTQRACAEVGPWHLLVGCMMLNKTDRRQARPAIRALFDLAPIPEDLQNVRDDQLLAILHPCGLANRRLIALRAMTADWLTGRAVKDLRYCGQYALDSYDIFVRHKHVALRADIDSEIARYLSERETMP
jgi:hypothetical protein